MKTKKDSWIPVWLELPDDDIVVIAHAPEMSGEPVWLATFDGECQVWRWIDGGVCHAEITHWQHLPEPPSA